MNIYTDQDIIVACTLNRPSFSHSCWFIYTRVCPVSWPATYAPPFSVDRANPSSCATNDALSASPLPPSFSLLPLRVVSPRFSATYRQFCASPTHSHGDASALLSPLRRELCQRRKNEGARHWISKGRKRRACLRTITSPFLLRSASQPWPWQKLIARMTVNLTKSRPFLLLPSIRSLMVIQSCWQYRRLTVVGSK